MTIGISVSIVSFAQKVLQGKLTYKAELSGEGAEMAKSMMPDSYEYWVGKGSVLFKMKGGMAESMLGEILILPDGNTYMIKHTDKTYVKLNKEGEEAQSLPKPKVELQEEVINILGFECKKYLVEAEVNGEVATQYVWVTDKYKLDFAPKSKTTGAAGGIIIDGINGISLKIRASVMGMTSILTAIALEEKKLPKSTFKLPKGYTQKEFDPMQLLGF